MITKDMLVIDILDMGEKYGRVFERHLLTCAGCSGAATETLEDAAESHGINLEALLVELNNA